MLLLLAATAGCRAAGQAPPRDADAASRRAWPTAINARPLAPTIRPPAEPTELLPAAATPTPAAPASAAPAAPAWTVPAPTAAAPTQAATVPAAAPPPVAADADPIAPAPPGAAPPTLVDVAGGQRLAGLVHTWQKWNNCGPSAAVMALSAFGIARDQLAAAAELKPHDRDTNVTPEELAAYLSRQGLRAIVRPGGDRAIARALIRAGVPVLAEQWIAVDGRGEMGHYRVLYGVDDAAGTVTAMDSYYGGALVLPFDALEAEWRPFLGTYVLGFLPEQEGAVRAALGADWDAAAAWARVRAALEADAAGARAGEAWTWFALGEARERTGDNAGAIAAHERAIAMGLPLRAHWYQFGFARALAGAGQWERLLAHAETTGATMDGENLEEWHYWRGRALRALGREAEATAAFERALAFNPNLGAASEALAGR